MNYDNSAGVVMLSNKIVDIQLPRMYYESIYSWIENGCPETDLQKFYYITTDCTEYIDSSFFRWGDDDIRIIKPIRLTANNRLGHTDKSYFNDLQFNLLLYKTREPLASDYEKLIWKYVNEKDKISINDISLNLVNSLVNVYNNMDSFIFTPIIIYIIRELLGMN
jgi:hypothetical protein